MTQIIKIDSEYSQWVKDIWQVMHELSVSFFAILRLFVLRQCNEPRKGVKSKATKP